MNRTKRWTAGVALLVVAALSVVMVAPLAGAQTAADPLETAGRARRSDKLSHPYGDKRTDLLMQAAEARAKGAPVTAGGAVEVAPGTSVQFEVEDIGAIWTVCGEFPDYPHNNIPEPDRDYDNTTLWLEDFSREYFLDMLFSTEPGAISVRNYFLEQSSGRYNDYRGDVTEWIEVPNDHLYYDDGPDEEGNDTSANVWYFLEDTVAGWYDREIASGKTPAEIEEYLAGFDTWDRYDYDGDDDHDEPDGYIDHFQSIHSGEDEAAGGGELGTEAIWSHSWYAYPSDTEGPAINPRGGIRIGDTDYWIGDYTIQPENGGAGVFAHEFTHDLGAPDLYDLSAGSNSVAFWSLMDSGSWLTEVDYDIGSKPNHLGAWEKFFLGWLDYDTAVQGVPSSHKLGPAEFTSTKASQALLVTLEPKWVERVYGDPAEGDYYFYSGSGNDMDNYVFREVTVAAGGDLTAMVKYEIEEGWDYAYVVVSTDGGTRFTSVPTTASTDENPFGQNFGYGITGSTGGAWVSVTADLSAYVGQTVMVGFRYWTDPAVALTGFMADAIEINGVAVPEDSGWVFKQKDKDIGFILTDGDESGLFDHYYLAEYRTYLGWDNTLEVGPYNFGWYPQAKLYNWVEHFPYQDGLLIWYWDTSERDNNTSEHPGRGMVLPIDAHPDALHRNGNRIWNNRIQSYDATFGPWRTEALTLHFRGIPYDIPSLPAVPVFDDRLDYYDETNRQGSVIVPVTGTQIRITKVSQNKSYMSISVVPVPVD